MIIVIRAKILLDPHLCGKDYYEQGWEINGVLKHQVAVFVVSLNVVR